MQLQQRELASSIAPPASINSLSIYFGPTGGSWWLKLIGKAAPCLFNGLWRILDNDQFTRDCYSSQNFSSSPIKTHHPPFLICLVCCNNPSPPDAALPNASCTHEHTHTSLLSYNSTEQTLPHLRNCYFVAGLFLFSAVAHKFFLPLNIQILSWLPSNFLDRKLLFSAANSVPLPPALTFRCHPSTASMPDCFDRPQIRASGGISSVRGAQAARSILQPPDAEP